MNLKLNEFSTNDLDIFRVCPEVFHKIDVLKDFVNFTGKHLFWIFYLGTVVGLAYSFITKETPAQMQKF